MIPAIVGVLVAIASGALCRFSRLDRDRACYPILLIVIALYYVLFAAMAGPMDYLPAESIAAMAFTVVAVVGFRVSLWWVVVGLAGHGVFDSIHHHLITDPGVPVWWPMFCLTADVGLAVLLAALLLGRGISARKET